MATTAATTATSGNLISIAVIPGLTREVRPQIAAATRRRRNISPEAGRAIEMLGHAIEYLSDEFALECMSHKGERMKSVHPQIEAIELLMARNREVYFSCPEVPSLGERLRSLLSAPRA